MKNILLMLNFIDYRYDDYYKKLIILWKEKWINIIRSSVYEYAVENNSFVEWEIFNWKEWSKIENIKADLVWYKSNTVNYLTRIIEENNNFINNTKFVELVNDKYITSLLYNEFSPKSDIIDNIKNNLSLLDNFSTEELILKPNWWSWWEWITKITKKEIENYINDSTYNWYLVQEFIDFSWWINWIVEWMHDIRFVIFWDKIDFPIIRIPKWWDICCNISRWGSIIYPEIEKIPKKILDTSHKIQRKIFQDFWYVFGTIDLWLWKNWKVYLMELNSSPWIRIWSGSERLEKEYYEKIIETLINYKWFTNQKK